MKALAGCPRCPCRPKMGSVMSECRRCSGSLKCFERITDHNQKSHSQKRTLNARRSGQTSLAFAEALILQTSLALLMRTMEIKNLVTGWSHVGNKMVTSWLQDGHKFGHLLHQSSWWWQAGGWRWAENWVKRTSLGFGNDPGIVESNRMRL